MADLRKQTDMTQATHACPYCSAPLTSPRRVQCGAPECKRQYRNERQRDFQAKHRAATGRSYSRQYDKSQAAQHQVTCAECGNHSLVTRADARYCSLACWYESSRKANRARHSQVELAWKPTLRLPRTIGVTVLRPLRRRWFSACCPMCSTWFVTDNPKHQHCSPQCGRRASKDKRRALERDAFVAPVSRPWVYERDQWTCQLCREPVARDQVVPHPQAPTIDHIIPLARGGTHEPANVQLAHYWCNTIKSDGEWAERGKPAA
ncbi:HNH endonuclease [Streptomyces sp. NPDC059171]|uniref:HNH endonuclease n=1 Tax=Streptomyces sp. NPDC059171 TaxID=3346755 RepID=UPI0036BCDA58